MKNMILSFLKKWAISYAIINIILMIVTYIVVRRFGVDIAFYKVSIGALLMALFVAISITIFRLRKWHPILKISLGFISLAPIIFLARYMFGTTIFRYSFAIYIFAGICTVIYGLAVLTVAASAKKQEKELNALLNLKEKQEKEDSKEE
jgi:lysylphosphatidylglycerol synthetase-like protein (DUF2156 family)